MVHFEGYLSVLSLSGFPGHVLTFDNACLDSLVFALRSAKRLSNSIASAELPCKKWVKRLSAHLLANYAFIIEGMWPATPLSFPGQPG